MLLEHPGEVVAREELQKRLWPADTFVDFDHSLNTAIKKLRLALCDDKENPRFIETLPKRGYRFIGTVKQPAKQPSSAPQATPPLSPSNTKSAAASISVGRVARVSTEGKRSEEHTSELQSRLHLVCRLLLEKKKHRPTSG